MIVEDHKALPEAFVSARVTIVGAGAVGLAIGLCLSRAGVTVLILEAGKQSPPKDFQQLNLGTAVGKPHRGLKVGRMRALGGTTKLWGGQLVAFGPLDFDGIPEAGVRGWPIAYAEVVPFIDRAFEFLGIGANERDEQAIWRRFADGTPDLGENLKLGMNIWLPTPDFSQLFAKEIEASQHLCVLTEASVEGLVMDDAGIRVTGVRLGSDKVLPVRQLVMANGTFEIIRLLLRAAALEPKGIFARLPRLGEGFVDHLHGLAGEIIVEDQKALSSLFDNIYFEGRKFGIKIRASDNFRARARISNCAGTINAALSPHTLVRDTIELTKRIFGGEVRNVGRLIREGFVMTRIFAALTWRYLVQRRSSSLLSRGVYLGLELEQLPNTKSRIVLDPDQPPASAPVLLHWDYDGREIDAAAAFCTEIDAQFQRLGVGRVTIDPLILARDPAFLDRCHDSNHHMGGAAIGRSPAEGVVDTDGKVFGSDNLYIAGPAIFPSGSFANPTLTAIALALRLSDHVAARC